MKSPTRVLVPAAAITAALGVVLVMQWAGATTSPPGPGGRIGSTLDRGLLQRFHWAKSQIEATAKLGVYSQWQCPEGMRLGRRRAAEEPQHVGTTCEPWIVRSAVMLLSELLLPGTAKALEWSSGSSTQWLLMGRVAHLISIEHHPGWAAGMQAKMEAVYGKQHLEEHWSMRHIPTTTLPEGGADAAAAEDALLYADYTAAAFLEPSQLGTFDFVSVDGRARVACLQRALGLLKPHAGVLVLDNADRSRYLPGIELVPDHWLRYDGIGMNDTTLVWVSCHKGSCSP